MGFFIINQAQVTARYRVYIKRNLRRVGFKYLDNTVSTEQLEEMFLEACNAPFYPMHKFKYYKVVGVGIKAIKLS